ncbi:MAG TPA: peptidyl-prolyl cis-trans isomerase [Polyangiales bacterium]|nr:peptidyl-prolyl cis-trans isomerase [Polyangiales bacterium]
MRSLCKLRIFGGLALIGWGVSLHVQAAPSRSEEDEARRKTVVASYTGGEVTVGEVEDAIGIVSPLALTELKDSTMVQHWYDQTLRNELLLAEAQRRGYAKNFAARRRVEELAVDLMLAGVIGEPLKTWNPSDEALQEFFKTRQAELGAPELRRVVELVVATEAEARALMPKFQSAQGAELRELIKTHSLDEASKNDDGYSRYFDRAGLLDDRSTKVDPALATAAFALPSVGAFSDVVALTPAGPQKRFALLKLLAVRPAYVPSLQQATPVMKKLMTDEKREQDRATLEADARKRFPPKIRYELLNSLPAEIVPETEVTGQPPLR